MYVSYICYAKSLQSCPTLCDPIDSSPPGSPVPGILQARTLEWVAISFSNAWKGKVKVKSLSPVRLFTTPWSAAYQAPLSMGFSRQEHWNGVPLPSPFIYIHTYIWMNYVYMYIIICDNYLSIYQSVKSRLIGKDSDAEKDWRQKEEGVAEDEIIR